MEDKLTIGVDGNEANVEKQVGVSVYTLNLLKYFQSNTDKKIHFIIYLRKKPGAWMPEEKDNFRYRIVRGPIFWSQFFLPLNLYFQREINIFFSPAHYTPRFCPVPLVVTIHDLSYFYYPEEFLKKDLYKLINWTARAINKSKSIIAVSKTTKKDILKHYIIPEEKIKVIYNGYSKNESDIDHSNIMENIGVEKNRFILYVGTLQPRKNIPVLISAFKLVSSKFPDYKLVIVGKKGWLWESIYSEVNKTELKEKIILTGYLPDKDVVTLYRNAGMFVLPSLYEGFGIPILEAMANSCPVIASYGSSLPEIGGEASLYFDSSSPNALADKIETLVSNQQLRTDLINKGTIRSKEFSWDECGRVTLDLLKEACKK